MPLPLTIKQISPTEIGVDRDVHYVTTVTYTYAALVTQRAAVQAQKDQQIAARDAELADLDALIQAAVGFGLDQVKPA